jgi:acetylornithine/LysW-gamma-L-lysine aminotransferase
MKERNLPQEAAEKGAWLMSEIAGLNLANVREIRGRGLIIGLELKGRVTPVLQALQERGVLALPAGNTVLRLLPPLTISYEEMGRIIEALREVL